MSNTKKDSANWSVKGVPWELRRRTRVYAAEREKKIGEVVTEALEAFLDNNVKN